MIYKIKAGRHFSNRLFPRFHLGTKRVSFIVNLYGSCYYEAPQHSRAAEQINKLPGLTYGFYPRHQNEFQFGWRSVPGEGVAELFAYFWINGKKLGTNEIVENYKLCDIDFNQNYYLDIFYLRGKIFYYVSDIESNILSSKEVEYNGDVKGGWILKPYNGGTETYDQDMYSEVIRVY